MNLGDEQWVHKSLVRLEGSSQVRSKWIATTSMLMVYPSLFHEALASEVCERPCSTPVWLGRCDLTVLPLAQVGANAKAIHDRLDCGDTLRRQQLSTEAMF